MAWRQGFLGYKTSLVTDFVHPDKTMSLKITRLLPVPGVLGQSAQIINGTREGEGGWGRGGEVGLGYLTHVQTLFMSSFVTSFCHVLNKYLP